MGNQAACTNNNLESEYQNPSTSTHRQQNRSQQNILQIDEDSPYFNNMFLQDSNPHIMINDEQFRSLQNQGDDLLKYIKRSTIRRSKHKCPVCLNKYLLGDIVRKMPCDHRIHESCLIPWFSQSKSCPICRLDLAAYYSDF